MEILSVNAQTKLTGVVSAIGRNPLSWQGWFSLHITMANLDDDRQQECLLWTKSIIESYLQDTEGRVFFCGNNHIHILCKSTGQAILEETGTQICELFYAENGMLATYQIYNLATDGFSYAQRVLEENDDIFSIPVSALSGLENSIENKISEIGRIGAEKRVMNHQDYTKVLLVEDDPVTRWMVRNALKYECQFATAPTANKAFAMYSSYQPDIVFLDINLPDKNGYEVLEWIMRNDPGACVVMFSSNDNLDNITGALEDGASGFIAKPFLKESLLHYIHNHTG